jgi:Amt family ammonium transporter
MVKRLRSSLLLALAVFVSLSLVLPCFADEPAPAPAPSGPTTGDLKVAADTIWVMVTAMLVFFMNLGFACVESGFCRAKNCVNILSKNFIVFAAASIGFWLIGWGLMFGSGTSLVGTEGAFMVGGSDNSPATSSLASLLKSDIKDKYGLDLSDKDTAAKNEKLLAAIDETSEKARTTVTEAKQTFNVSLDIPGQEKFEKTYEGKDFYWGAYAALSWTGVPLWAKFFFQLVFAGTAATIVSGAVAERIKYHSFILFSFLITMCIYPVVGHWIWGGGWLSSLGFVDFAGSTQVHSIGGWAALAGILVLGPRIGKYGPDGKPNAIPGHNLTAATIGCFVLWFGWFGFNPGSTMAADPTAITEVAVTTNIAAAAATLSATVVAWLLLGKPDLGMTLNGCLAGLVAITAPCAFVTVSAAVVIGLIAGGLVVLGVLFFDRLRIDDPVGATSVHLLNGIFGTLCVGLFATPDRIARSGNAAATAGLFYGGGAAQLVSQLIGVAAAAGYVFAVALVLWLLLKYTVGIRVSREEELEGLDIGEHGNEAYHGFVMSGGLEMVHAGITEPRPATVPPDGQERFTLVVDGVESEALANVWSDLCQPRGKEPAPEFRAVYPHMTTVQGNRFRFRGGDPQLIRENLERLLSNYLNGQRLGVHVER